MEQKKPRRLKKALISISVIALALVIVAFVARMPVESQEIPQREEVPLPVEVWRIETVPSLPDMLELPGALEPNKVIEIPAEQRGRIERIHFKEGELVEPGQVLLQLDQVLLEAELEKAKAQAAYDQRNYTRALELLERGVLNRNEVEELEARKLVSAANLELARTNLDRATVRSPMRGVIDKLLRDQGEYVAPGDSFARLVDVETLKLVVMVPERDLRYVSEGKRIEVSVDALDGARVSGSVSFMSRTADEATRTTRVEVALDNRNGRLYSGMIVRARISRRILQNVIMIPLAAVIPAENSRYVYVAKEGVAESREVELGIIRGSQVQILSGLAPGELLIVKGHRQVGPGQLVAPAGVS